MVDKVKKENFVNKGRDDFGYVPVIPTIIFWLVM